MLSCDPDPRMKFTFGLWTVGNPGRDPFGWLVREPLRLSHGVNVYFVEDYVYVFDKLVFEDDEPEPTMLAKLYEPAVKAAIVEGSADGRATLTRLESTSCDGALRGGIRLFSFVGLRPPEETSDPPWVGGPSAAAPEGLATCPVTRLIRSPKPSRPSAA